jgi:hypothetical protein
MAAAEPREMNAPEIAKGSAGDEIALLEARQEQLLVLVGELLRANEELRQQLARLETQEASTQMI